MLHYYIENHSLRKLRREICMLSMLSTIKTLLTMMVLISFKIKKESKYGFGNLISFNLSEKST